MALQGTPRPEARPKGGVSPCRVLAATLEAQPDSSVALWVQLPTSPSPRNNSKTTENSDSLPVVQ